MGSTGAQLTAPGLIARSVGPRNSRDQAGMDAVCHLGAVRETPLLSVVIVAYNSKAHLQTCLPTLSEQGVPLEIIVVDNRSSDGVVEWLRHSYPEVRLVALPGNLGFAAGSNRGIGEARGEYVLVLNPDTTVHPGAIRELLRVAEAHPRAFINPKLLQPDGTVNACGLEMHYTGIPRCTGLNEGPDGYQGVHRPLLVIGTAVLARRDVWLDVGGFDEHFFLYLEDMDLSLRAILQGYEMLCAADALVTHRYRLEMRPQKLYWLERNRLLTIFKTYESRTLRHLLVPLVLTEIATWTYAALRGWSYLAARLSVYTWLWHHRHEWRQARSRTQALRRAPDIDVITRMVDELPYDQLIPARWLAGLLHRLTMPMYSRHLWLGSRPMPQIAEVADQLVLSAPDMDNPAAEVASA